MSKGIIVELNADEALVFFEWLSRAHQNKSLHFCDQAEERVLFDIECMLEKQLVAPLSPDYDRVLQEARARVRDAK